MAIVIILLLLIIGILLKQEVFIFLAILTGVLAFKGVVSWMF